MGDITNSNIKFSDNYLENSDHNYTKLTPLLN